MSDRIGLLEDYSVNKKLKVIDLTAITPSLATFASATGAAVTIASDGTPRCSWTSATSGQYTGMKYENPTGTWDLTEHYNNGGYFGIDCGFPPGVTTDSCLGAYVQVYFCCDSGTTFTNYARSEVLANFSKQRRHFLFSPRSKYGSGGGTFNPAAVKRIEIRLICSLASYPFPAAMDVYSFWAGTKSRTKVLLALDDEFKTAFDEFYLGITGVGMADYGWKGTLYLSTDNVNGASRMTTAEVQTLIDAGWTVAPHSDSHTPLAYNLSITSSGTTATASSAAGHAHGKIVGNVVNIVGAFYPEYNGEFTIATVPTTTSFTYTMSGTPLAASSGGRPYMQEWQSDAWRRSRIETAQGWMDANLVGHDNLHMAFVNGGYNDSVVELMQEMGFKTCRTTDNSGWPAYGISNQVGTTDFHRLPTIDMTNTATAASILAIVDTCTLYGSSCIIYGHEFVTTPSTSTEFAIAQKTLLLEGLRLREMMGKIDVGMTIEEWKNGLTKPSRQR